ncbi:enoyl-CoA hydratase/isomerase family protein [Fretibacter rubidus]|uniref:enoyl-CoA hydratase/isomerase family protein n=1 Tax=Fretibacter rubidus TaxID=570162 RepID=UPI00352BADAD
MTTLPSTEKLALELKEGWLTIWFDSAENRNALGAQLSAELHAVLDALRDDRTVRGITLRGKHGIFCAGADLKSFNNAIKNGANHADIAKMNKDGGVLFHKVNTMPQVVLAYVEGAAIAGGLGLMCCADVITVTKDAKFSLTETMLGIAPAQIAPIVTARVGLPTARRLMLTAARFTGEQALSVGLADYVVDGADDFDVIEADIKKGVMKCGPHANAVTKEILQVAPYLQGDAMMDFAADGFARCMLSDESAEGIASFFEKRKPKWAP